MVALPAKVVRIGRSENENMSQFHHSIRMLDLEFEH